MSQKENVKARDEAARRLQIEKDVLAKLQAKEPALVTLQTDIRAQIDKARFEAATSLAQATPDQLVKLATQRAKADYEVQALEDSLQEIMRRQKELREEINAQQRNVQTAEILIENSEWRLEITEVLSQLGALLPRIKATLDARRNLKRLPNQMLWILGRFEEIQTQIEKAAELASDVTLDF